VGSLFGCGAPSGWIWPCLIAVRRSCHHRSLVVSLVNTGGSRRQAWSGQRGFSPRGLRLRSVGRPLKCLFQRELLYGSLFSRRDFSRVLTLRTFRLVGPPAPSQALTSPVAPNGHRRAFLTRRRAPCRDSVRAAWLPPRPEPLPRMPFKATSSRFRTPSIGSIPTSSAGNGHSDEQLAPNFQATWTPFLRSAATRPVTACGSPLFATPRRYLRHLSASSAFGKKAPLTNLCNQTELSNRAPCETASFRDGFRLAPVRPPFSGPALPPARYVRALEQHRRRRRRLAAFGGVAGPGWCRGLGVPRAPAAIIRLCFPAMGPPLLCQGRA
jgi:hypothetical protein